MSDNDKGFGDLEDASFHSIPQDEPATPPGDEPSGAELNDPSPTPPADLPSPVKVPPGTRRRVPGKPDTSKSKAPRPAGERRPVMTSVRPQAGSKGAKYAMLAILILIPGLVAAGFAMGTWQRMLREMGWLSKPTPSPKPTPAEHYEIDDEFKKATDAAGQADAFVAGDLKTFDEKYAATKPAIPELQALLDKIDLTMATLPGALETIDKVRVESQKPPGARQTTIAAAEATDAMRKAEATKKTLQDRSAAWRKVLVEIKPRVDLGTSVEADPLTPSSMSPWADLAAGAWWRARTGQGGKESYEDTIVESIADGKIKLHWIAFADGKKSERDAELPVVDAGAKIGSSEKVDVGGRAVPAQLVESEGGKRWICREDAGLNFVALKGEGSGYSFKAVTMSSEEINVGGRLASCVVVDIETTIGGATTRQREWHSKSVPGWLVKRESPESTLEVVAFGTAADARPPFPGEVIATPTPSPTPTPTPTPTPSPTPEPPDPKIIAQAKLDEGNALLQEAVPLYKEIATAITALPEDKDSLNALLAKADSVNAKFDGAVAKYLEGKDLAPDAAAVDKRIASIGKFKSKLAEYVEQIRAKLPK